MRFRATGGNKKEFTTLDEWSSRWDNFERPDLKEGRSYIWVPPPYVADIAIAELRKARIKRQTSSHVFVVSKLCCSFWIKQLYKASDPVMEIPAGHSFWPSHMH